MEQRGSGQEQPGLRSASSAPPRLRWLLRACLVYVNTLFIQEVLAEPAWRARMTPDDWRGLSPLLYHHVNPYGRIELDMTRRLPLAA